MDKLDLSKMSEHEIESLVKELSDRGYITENNALVTKYFAISKAMRKRGAKNSYITPEIKGGIYKIADNITNNRESPEVRRGKMSKSLPADPQKRQEYLEIVDGIIGVIYPKYGIEGFCEK